MQRNLLCAPASGLAALKSGKDMSVAKTHLDRALRVLGLTHGDKHKVTENARQTAALVAQLMSSQQLVKPVSS